MNIDPSIIERGSIANMQASRRRDQILSNIPVQQMEMRNAVEDRQDLKEQRKQRDIAFTQKYAKDVQDIALGDIKLRSTKLNKLASILEDVKSPEDYERFKATAKLPFYNIPVPEQFTPDFKNQLISEAKGIDGKLAEMKATVKPKSPTALIMEFDTPENRQSVVNDVNGLVSSGKMDMATATGILSVNQSKGAWYGSEALEKFTGGVGTAVAKESGTSPIKTQTALTIEQGKADITKRMKEVEAAQAQASKESGNIDDMENLLTSIEQIEQNPSILENLPSGWSNLGGAIAKYLPAENAGIYAANLQRITDIMALVARQKIKGQGQISDKETDLLKNAATNIKSGTAKQRKVELARIKELAQKVKYRVDNNIYIRNGKEYKEENGVEVEVGGQSGTSGGHIITIGNKKYQYKGTGDTADISNYTEMQ